MRHSPRLIRFRLACSALLSMLLLSVQNCQDAEYSQNGRCLSCPANCRSCTPEEGRCLRCQEGYAFAQQSNKLACAASSPTEDSWKIILLLVGLLLVIVAIGIISSCWYLRRKRIGQGNETPAKEEDFRVVAMNRDFLQGPPAYSNPERDECAICLSGSTNLITACGHQFHLDCYQRWALVSQCCPNCNTVGVAVKYQCSGCGSYSLRIALCSTSCPRRQHDECAKEYLKAGAECQKCRPPLGSEATGIHINQ